MSWSFWVCDTRTGVKQLEVFPSGGSWSKRLNGSGSGSHIFQLGDRLLSRELWRSLTTPHARTLVVCRNDVPMYAGIIASRSYNRDSKTLTVNHVDMRTFLEGRYTFGATSYHGGTLVCTNLSLRSVAGRVVQAGLTGPRDIYSLPIVLPPLSEAGPYSFTYDAYNFPTVPDVLDGLQKMDGGPDIDFAERWSTSNTLEWEMRTGTPTVPLLGGNSFDFNMTSPEPALTNVVDTEDGSKQVTGVFVIGQGSEEDMIVGGIPAGTELPAIIPARDTSQPQKTVKTELEASGYSVAASAALHDLTEQWSFKFVANDKVAPLERLVLGSTLRLYFKDDEWVPDDWRNLRLVGLAGDMTETVTPTVLGAN